MTAQDVPDTSLSELDTLLAAASSASGPWGNRRPAERAQALRQVADALDAAGDELVPLAQEESHLPEARLRGELVRTTFQVRLFADVLDEGSYLALTLDTADGDWPPGPRPDLRRMMFPLGPVVVFAASNFPFAFSVAGGDTASALAAGCPVILKAHPGHPRLSIRTGEIVASALPEGVFAVIVGNEAGAAAVTDSRIKAGAFTGSIAGGRALFDLAAGRPDPIPFYGELGSLNPAFVTRAALAERRADIVSGFVGSFTLGTGQFCTKPGLLFVPVESGVEDDLVAAASAVAPAPMLNERIAHGYDTVLSALSGHSAVRTLLAGAQAKGTAGPTLLSTTVKELLEDSEHLLEECFGPTALVVTYTDESELVAAASAFGGQLTATVHGVDDDTIAPALLGVLREKAGRILWNGWPTGVAVSWAMHHGGPYPATTAVSHTSVGTSAIDRFLRPVTYQSMPQALLPEALRDDNPYAAPRRVNGILVLR